MQPGNLVKIIRAGIGIPKDSLALILESIVTKSIDDYDLPYHVVVVFQTRKPNMLRRFLERDLELVS
tara:strand:+ start:281 stop:481 length:201 start_codon:yes stop_codon:yes gene_type:complete